MKNPILRIAPLGLLGAAAACAGGAPPAATPGPASASEAETEQFPTTPPPPLPARPMQFPEFTERTLPNGLRLIVVENHAQPVVDVDLYVLSGDADDPADKAGLAELVATMLDKGTDDRSAVEIAETIENVGGSIGASSGADRTSVFVNVLSDQLPLAFDLLGDVVTSPTFPEEELETARRQKLSELQASLGQPGAIAGRTFAEVVYGEHPYSRAPLPETVRGVTREDLEAFHERHFVPENAVLVVAGDVTPERAAELAMEHLGDWDGNAPAQASRPAPPRRDAARIYLVHRPGSVQSNVVVGHLGLTPDDPDYYAVQVMNQILGGGPDSRLFQILREQKGWTYGAYSGFDRVEGLGDFSATAEVRTEVTDSAVVELLDQLRRLREEPVSDEEIAGAKSFLVGSFPLRFQTPGSVAGQVAGTRLLGLPIEHLREYPERIRAVTKADVQRVAGEYLHPGRAAIVIVGDATQVLPKVEGIAPVTLLDVRGEPLDRSAVEVRASTETFDASRLEPGTRRYAVVVQGNPMGNFTRTLAREGDVWVASQALRVGPVSQDAETRFTGALEPVSMSMTMTGAAEMDIDLRVEDGRLVGSAELPEQMGGSREVDQEMVQGLRLSGMESELLAVSDLEVGREISIPVYSVQSNGVSTYTLTVEAEEEITVPAGTFETYRVAVQGGQAPTTVWVRKEAPHVMIKQAVTGQPFTIELQSME